MSTIVFIIIIIGVAVALYLEVKFPDNPKSVSVLPSYIKKNSVMNQSEAAFFFELKKQLPPEYYIFPKMRIADTVDVIHGRGFYQRRNQVLPKHVDFLVCDKNFSPIVAIEINGKSHQRQDRIERDDKVKQIFKDANIPLEIVEVGSSFVHSVDQIKTNISRYV